MQATLRVGRALTSRITASRMAIRTVTSLAPCMFGMSGQMRYGFSMGREEEMKAKGQQFYKNYVEDVVEMEQQKDWKEFLMSFNEPLILDFYADWCQPCKQLTPRLEAKVKQQNGKVKLIKINIDKMSDITNTFMIKSVPSVMLFYKGKVYDGFAGNFPDQQLDKLFEVAGKVAGGLDDAVVKALEQAQQLIRNKNFEQAEKLLTDTDTKGSVEEVGYVKNIFLGYVYSQLGKMIQLKAIVDTMRPQEAFYTDKEDFKALYLTLVDLVDKYQQEKQESNQATSWADKIAQSPADLQVKFDAAAYYKQEQMFDEACELLLQIVKADRNWNQKIAQKTLLQVFKEMGNTSPSTKKYRQLLQRALY